MASKWPARLAWLCYVLVMAEVCQAHKHNSNQELLEEVERSHPFEMEEAMTKTEHWVSLGNLANVAGVKPFRTVYLPVDVNIFALGFQGNGNLGVKVPMPLMREWLEHLDHIVPHTVVPSGVNPETDPGTDLSHHNNDLHVAADMSRNISEAAQVKYRYKFRLIETHPDVVKVLERVLHGNYRLVSNDDEHKLFSNKDTNVKARYQVNPHAVANLLNELALECGVSNGYNIFILNPRSSWPFDAEADTHKHHFKQTHARYGYRSGLSNAEIDKLVQDEVVDRMTGENSDTHVKPVLTDSNAADPLNAIREKNPVSTESAEPLTRAKLLDQEDNAKGEDTLAKGHMKHEHSTGTITEPEHIKMVQLSRHWAQQLLKRPFPSGPIHAPEYISTMKKTDWGGRYLSWLSHNQYAQEDCLVDGWVSHRSAFIDLTAGPFNWGPVVGGEGVRTPQTVPRIDIFSSIHKSEAYKAKHAADTHVKPEEKHDDDGDALTDAAYNWESIKAEKLVLVDYIKTHCDTSTPGSHYTGQCKEMYTKLKELEAFVAQHKPGHKVDKSDFHEADSFSFFNDGIEAGHHYNLEADHFLSHLSSLLSHALHQIITPSSGDQFGVYADRVTFHIYVLANHKHYRPLDRKQLGLLKGAIEQLRLPKQEFVFATHLLTMQDDPSLSMAYVNALKSATVPTLRLDGSFAAIKRLYLDSHILANELSALSMEKKAHLQAKHRRYRRLRNKHRRHARSAYGRTQTSRIWARERKRKTRRERLRKRRKRRHSGKAGRASSGKGHHRNRKRKRKVPKVRRSRQKRNRRGREKRKMKRFKRKHSWKWKRIQRQIPIFLFSLDYPLPVFIDKYYQSKAIDGMVVAVQSAQHLWETHLSCNRKPIYWNLRDPTRAIVSSVASVLGGLLPSHLLYSRAHNRTAQNWAWAVGNSPVAPTTAGLYFSPIHADVVHRNYVVNGIRESTSMINAAIHRLSSVETTVGNEVLKYLKARTKKERRRIAGGIKHERRLVPTLKLLKVTHRKFSKLLSTVWSRVESLEYQRAVLVLPYLHKLAFRFTTLTRIITKDAKKLRCTKPPQAHKLDKSYYMAAVIVCVALVLTRLLTSALGPSKPKVN